MPAKGGKNAILGEKNATDAFQKQVSTIWMSSDAARVV
jgi:hypothetical protein